MEIAPIVGLPRRRPAAIFRGNRLDLVLVHHDPDEEHSMVHVLLGESGFQWDAIRRDLDNSGSVPAGTEFLIGSHQGATAIYEVQRARAAIAPLRVFGLRTLRRSDSRTRSTDRELRGRRSAGRSPPWAGRRREGYRCWSPAPSASSCSPPG